MTLAADLRRSEAYGALRPPTVDVVETHISWVFLAGDRVFKVKKPVDLGFVDFSSIDRRRVACEAEVSLNARLAPDVYRGVVPVRRDSGGRFSLGTRGEIVDWAVSMVRLPDEQRADQLIARGSLSGEAIDAVAARIASFHASALPDADTARFATPAAIEGNVEENFAQVGARARSYLGSLQSDEIVRWQTAFVRGHADRFVERITAGRVRDGHGDLRLEHVYLPPSGGPTIIDCIEFAARFRFADVCADIAFLSMDLAAHRRVDLAERLLARYARDANDFDLYSLVDFYESYRAYVRGKIASIVASDASLEADARRRAEEAARRYFLVALASGRRLMLLPAVVAVGGVIASGKSTIADRIGLELSAPVVEADRTRKAMLRLEATRTLDELPWKGAYDPAFTGDVYAEVFRRAGLVLASGRPVVIDASFQSRAMRRSAQDLADRHQVPFRFVECRADPSICRSRLLARASTRGVSDGRLEIFDDFCARFDPVGEVAPDDHIVLDTGRTLDESLAMFRARLDTWPSGLVA